MESKKISFGFSKITKKLNVLIKNPPIESENKIELIKCLEGQEIKLIDEKPNVPPPPLVIPLIGHSKTSSALASLQKRKAILEGITIPPNDTEIDNKNELPTQEITNKLIENETIEKQAARELIKEISENSKLDNENSTFVLPIKSADELPLEGATESTMDDYENTPIQHFGKAMLRGMGWKEEISKKKPDDIEDGPVQRPKGMGLGADKAIKRHIPLIPADKNEVLEIKKKAFVRIIGGKNKDLYGQIEGFDDYSTRIIVRFALGGHTDAIHEFMIQPVSKKEYQQYSKVINSVKYDEYKKLENEHGQIKEEDRVKLELNNLKLKKASEIKKEIKTEIDSDNQQTENKNILSINKIKRHSSTESLNEERTNRSRSRDRNVREIHRRNKHKSSSLDSNNSNGDNNPHRRHHKSKKKSSKSKKSKKNKHHRSSSSDNDKRHKKKTKRSKRSRSRSKGRK